MNKVIYFITLILSIFLISCEDENPTEPTGQANTGPTVSFTASLVSDTVLTTFMFDASGSSDKEDEFSDLRFSWDWENDGTWDIENSTTYNPIHTYDSREKFDVKLRVTDTDSLTSDTTMTIYIPIEMEWVTVPSGQYTWSDENEIRNIDYDYDISKFEITNFQYVRFLKDALSNGYATISEGKVSGFINIDDTGLPSGNYEFIDLSVANEIIQKIEYNDGKFTIQPGYENHPVVSLTWFGAYAFAKYYDWTLPTNEEWEKAARGNTGFTYPWGDNIYWAYSNFNDSNDPFEPYTTPVGYYDGSSHDGFQTKNNASPFGAHDMAGNVREFVLEPYNEYTRDLRSSRGGSFSDNDSFYKLKVFFIEHMEDPFLLETSFFDLGFRVIKKSI